MSGQLESIARPLSFCRDTEDAGRKRQGMKAASEILRLTSSLCSAAARRNL